MRPFFLRSCFLLITAYFVFGAGCKPAPTASVDAAAAQKARSENQVLMLENLTAKAHLPPTLQQAFHDLYRNNKQHLDAMVQSVVKTAKTAAHGTPDQKAALILGSIRTIALTALAPSSAVLATLFKVPAEKLKIGAEAELEKFLSQKKLELVHSFQRSPFGFPEATQTYFTLSELVAMLGAEDSASRREIEVALLATPNEPVEMALANLCPEAVVSESGPCSYQKMSIGLISYGFVVLVVGLFALIFGAGMLQIIAIPVVSMGVFFFVIGLCARAAGYS